MCAMLFTISGSALDAAFPAVMIPLSAVLLSRRHGFITWWKLFRSRLRVVPVALAALLLYSQLWLAVLNHVRLGRWFGSAGFGPFALNADGIQGALANLVRYVFSSAHFTRPVDLVCGWAFGFTVSGALQRFYEMLMTPLAGNLGAAAPFAIHWLPDERVAWFGPFGFVLVLPAVGYAVLRASRRLKAIAVGLAGYFFLVVLVVGWCPENARFLTLFFVCGGFMLALFLPPWYVSTAGRRCLQVIAILLVIYAGVFNLQKPAVAPPKWMTGAHVDIASCRQSALPDACGPAALPGQSAWLASRWGRDRLEPSTRIFGDRRVAEISARVPNHATVSLVCRRPALTYPFRMAFPQAAVLETAALDDPNPWRSSDDPMHYVIFVDLNPPAAERGDGIEVLWKADPSNSSCSGALIRFTPSGSAAGRP